ncbi:hypothetical protein KP004_02920 [Geomonas oryzisoli]|uniref:Fibronectin type-III domain-containing protein n=1 Tax=Geomonas oryzisoli TaxID=2847992 RepID=A0ABX8J739_9BACT|nr:hypothetical protein [Geomonas oryzisoli]QWV94160.1 hypothetical protein KP004_02920 [Geomonas oryzisoli]
MLVPKHDISELTKLSDGDLIQETLRFAERIRAHRAFQDLQKHVPGPDRLTELATKLGITSEAARYGDKLKAEERDNTRDEIITAFIFACQHSVMVATHEKDPSLMDIGYQLSHRTYPAKPASSTLPGQPDKVDLRPGPKGSGIFWIIVSKIAGMGSIEAQYTENPSDEASWTSVERSYLCKIELKLDLVKRYYIRVRYHNNTGYGPWSAVTDIVLS